MFGFRFSGSLAERGRYSLSFLQDTKGGRSAYDLSAVSEGEAWMDDIERMLVKRLVQAFRKMFRGEQVPETPMVALRVQDVTVSFIRVQRAETRLAEIEARKQERMMLSEGKTKTDSGLGAAIEAAGKARERLRKALKELEDCRGQGGRDAGKGLADAVLPLMKAARGFLKQQ